MDCTTLLDLFAYIVDNNATYEAYGATLAILTEWGGLFLWAPVDDMYCLVPDTLA